MMRWTNQARWPRRGLAATGLVFMLAGCGGASGGSQPAAQGQQPPTANMKPPTSIGPGEGALNLIAWQGYTEQQWVAPFEQQTGCKVNAHYANTSDEMVSLMANGGGGQWDLVSSSGDADLRIIYAGDVRPVNVNLVPDWKNFESYFKAPPYNTINGVHYGISLQWGPNVLLYDKSVFPTAPTSWSVIYDQKYAGKITVPDNPIQIADAALYLMKTKSGLGISDPYELTRPQFDAAVNLLKQQRPLIKKYWALASDEISMFTNHDVVVGAAWPYQTSTLLAANQPVGDTVPKEGATGWGDTWMFATKAPHPNCAYMWFKYISTPQVQAEQAISYGETPVNSLACTEMDKLQAGSCAQYHGNASASYFNSIKAWKTPLAQCANGQQNCVPYSDWQNAWTSIKG